MEFLNRLQVNKLSEGTEVFIRWNTKKSEGEFKHVIRVTDNDKRYVGPVNLSDFMPWPEIRLSP